MHFFFFDLNNRCISPHSSGGGESGSRCEQGGLLQLLSLETATSVTPLGLPLLVLVYFQAFGSFLGVYDSFLGLPEQITKVL